MPIRIPRTCESGPDKDETRARRTLLLNDGVASGISLSCALHLKIRESSAGDPTMFPTQARSGETTFRICATEHHRQRKASQNFPRFPENFYMEHASGLSLTGKRSSRRFEVFIYSSVRSKQLAFGDSSTAGCSWRERALGVLGRFRSHSATSHHQIPPQSKRLNFILKVERARGGLWGLPTNRTADKATDLLSKRPTESRLRWPSLMNPPEWKTFGLQ